MNTNLILTLVLSLLGGSVIGFFGRMFYVKKLNQEAENKASLIIEEANTKKMKMILEAKDESLKIIDDSKKEEREKRNKLQQVEERLNNKELQIDKRLDAIDNQKEVLESKAQEVKKIKAQIEEIKEKQETELSKVASLSKEEAKEILLKKVEDDVRDELVNKIMKVEQQINEEAEGKARDIIGQAIQKYAAEVVSETTVTLVDLPSDDMKGRIIGREGRNINAIERATGVDIIVDDTPGVIVISGFDLIRRHTAKLALEKLIADGRIHPTRIEEAVNKAKEEIRKNIKDIGEKVVYEIGVTGFHPDLIKLLGRLKYRTSYGQNVLKHSVEVSYLAAHIAEELGADVSICKKAGLIHDIGKAVDHEISGDHATIGRDIAKKYGLNKEIVDAVESHEGGVPFQSVEAIIVYVANKISNTRPGARKDSLESYVKRLKDLENLVVSFEGVEKAYAIQAGREVRIIVNPEMIDDLKAVNLARKIANDIEKDMEYPGQIKVSLIREKRVVEFAK
jgi:ribonucrease Y